MSDGSHIVEEVFNFVVVEDGDGYDIIEQELVTTLVVESTDYDILEEAPQTLVDTEVDYEILTEGFPGPVGLPGTQGPAGAGTAQVNTTIPAGGTVVVDTLSAALYLSVKWFVSIVNSATSEVRSSEVMAIHNDTEVNHTHYGIIGNFLPCPVDVSLVAGQLELSITNNAADDLDINVVRVSTAK